MLLLIGIDFLFCLVLGYLLLEHRAGPLERKLRDQWRVCFGVAGVTLLFSLVYARNLTDVIMVLLASGLAGLMTGVVPMLISRTVDRLIKNLDPAEKKRLVLGAPFLARFIEEKDR